jgi:hypothetical protein
MSDQGLKLNEGIRNTVLRHSKQEGYGRLWRQNWDIRRMLKDQ